MGNIATPAEIELGSHLCDYRLTAGDVYWIPPLHCDEDAQWEYQGEYYCAQHIEMVVD